MAPKRKRLSSGSGTTYYQVFLSFRGPDTRQGFTDTLYHALIDAGIRVFRDNEEIRKGEDIGDEILSAIETSRIYVPVLSRNYAYSKWCMIELSKMFVSKEASSSGSIKKKILPIFYDVSVADVKRKTDLYDGAFSEHRKDPKISSEEVNRWEESLKKAGKIKGWELKDAGHAEFAKLFVREVSVKLKVKHKALSEYFVRRDDQEEELMKMLDFESPDVRFVGIHGMGGIGKTTLAKSVFNKLCDGFSHSCFLPDVRESSRQHKGIQQLQKQLLDDLGLRSGEITDVDDGISKIKEMVEGKKILIVLDDVDHKMQIQCLAGESSCYGSDSRIIITSRDKSLLEIRNQAVHTLEVEVMKPEEALRLFSMHAFGKDSPPDEYLSLSEKAVTSTGRLPLALEVIGSLLREKRRKHWKKTIKRLEKVPLLRDVKEKLMISYEALDQKTRQIFLDIACFFINRDKTNPTYMWEACGFDPEIGVKELVHLSLIKIIKEKNWRGQITKKLWMHDQLRDLGRNIVDAESFNGVRKHSRLWKYGVASAALQELDDEEKRNIEMLRLGRKCKYNFTEKELLGLRKLRYIQSIGGPNFNGNTSNALPKLLWLSLQYLPEDFMGTELQFRNLVILDLSNNDISEDWDGWRHIKFGNKLKVLNLSHCKKMRRTPDFSRFPCLERLILCHCEMLTDIDVSIGKLRGLKFLDIRDCSSLQVFPKELCSLDRLEVILGSGRRNTSFNMPNTSNTFDNLKSLLIFSFRHFLNHLNQLDYHLDLSFFPELKKLPNSIGLLKKLKQLDLSWCHELKKLPDSIGQLKKLKLLSLCNCAKLKKLPDSIGGLKSLAKLNLSYSGVTELPETIGMLKSLEELDASFCDSLASIPSTIKELSVLRVLDLQGICITELPSKLPTSLTKLLVLSYLPLHGILNVSNLYNLVELTLGCFEPNSDEQCQLSKLIGIRKLRRLVDLYLQLNIPSISKRLSSLSQLRHLSLWCSHLEACPPLPSSLSTLYLRGISGKTKLPKLSNLKNLSKLEFHECDDAILVNIGISELESLREIRFLACSSLRNLNACYLPKSTHTLKINGCPSLETVSALSHLKKLKELRFENAEMLAEIRELEELESLISLYIQGCNSLERLEKLSKLTKLKHVQIIECKEFKGIENIQDMAPLQRVRLIKNHPLCEEVTM